MADKLYSGLAPRAAVLTTDILAFLPLGGPPAEQADVTALLSDAASVLAIDRDNRQLIDSSVVLALDWQARIFYNSGGNMTMDFNAGLMTDTTAVNSVAWDSRVLFDAAGNSSLDWVSREFTDSLGGTALEYESRQLNSLDSSVSLDWSDDTGIFFPKPILGGGLPSIDPNTRELFKSDGTTVAVNWDTGDGLVDPALIDQSTGNLIDSSTNPSIDWESRILFASDGTTPVLDYSAQQPSSGPQTAGAVYTAVEKVMIQEMYDALRNYGLLS